jgi:hypothetical protein
MHVDYGFERFRESQDWSGHGAGTGRANGLITHFLSLFFNKVVHFINIV